MRLSDKTRYPHPILCSFTDDYTAGGFSINLEVKESRKTGRVELGFKVSLDEEGLRGLVDSGLAIIGVYIVCRRTYYNKFHQLELNGSILNLEKGLLREKVIVRAVVCASESVTGYSALNLHSDYHDLKWSFVNGDVLAIADELQVDVGPDKLASIETIFNLIVDDSVSEGEVCVDIGDHKILIKANKSTHKKICENRTAGLGRVSLLGGLYFPVVMDVLSQISKAPDDFSDCSWYRVFSAKCTELGINLESPDLIRDAQKLLKMPLKRVLSFTELDEK